MASARWSATGRARDSGHEAFLKFAAIVVGSVALLAVGGLWRVVLLHIAIRPGLRKLPRDGRLRQRGSRPAPHMNCMDCHEASLSTKLRHIRVHLFGANGRRTSGCATWTCVEMTANCRACHQQEYATWHAGPHSATYSQIFANPAELQAAPDGRLPPLPRHALQRIHSRPGPALRTRKGPGSDSLGPGRSAGDPLPDLPPGFTAKALETKPASRISVAGRGRAPIRWPSTTAANRFTSPRRLPFRNCTTARAGDREPRIRGRPLLPVPRAAHA
jgi:hypothetical protein